MDGPPLHYGLVCSDCRDPESVARLLGGRKVNLVITSPPYAAQREYDSSSGFEPIRSSDYVDWYSDVAATIYNVLAADGSYFLNIKEHTEEGERSLYVKDLVIAHKRSWAWRFIDEFCWRNTANGVPGKWSDRFKNAWEPIFHFCKQQRIKFRPEAVMHPSTGCFDYRPCNPKSTNGSGLLGTGKRTTDGLALPSNVIEARPETQQGNHSAPFAVALVEFFIKAFTDPGDVVFDPFLGSGTTMVAAMKHGRSCFGCEISPAYCDVIVERAQAFTNTNFQLDDGRSFRSLKREQNCQGRMTPELACEAKL